MEQFNSVLALCTAEAVIQKKQLIFKSLPFVVLNLKYLGRTSVDCKMWTIDVIGPVAFDIQKVNTRLSNSIKLTKKQADKLNESISNL